MISRYLCTALLCVCLGSATTVSAQSLVGQLGALLTEQRGNTSPVLVPDLVAAAATRDTVAGLFAVELGTLPLAPSSGGFVYRLNSALGVVERASDGFGPFFTERVLRNSRNQVSVGFSFQISNFASLQGADLSTGTFPTNAARAVGSAQAFSVDTLSLEIDSRSVTGFASYGLTDRLSLGAAVPLVHVGFNGQRVRTVNGSASTLQSAQNGSSTGLGDVALQARYLVAGESLKGVSAGVDFRLPTGRQEDLLGAGAAAARFVGIGSWEEARVGLHATGGVGVGGASRELFWSGAATLAASQFVTLVGEVMGRRLSELSLIQDVYEPHPQMAGVETMRWLPLERGIHTTFIATGAKWNVARSWLVNTSLLIRLNDAGLRARVTPTVSLDYAFQR